VSVPTVSKVLNGRSGVSTATRDKVMALLEKHGYSKHARSASRAAIIDLVLPGPPNHWSTQILDGVRTEASILDMDLVVTFASASADSLDNWLRRVSTRGSSGVVLVAQEPTGNEVEWIRRLDIPMVAICPPVRTEQQVPVVAASHWAGAREAVEHLVMLGHRRIATITGPLSFVDHDERLGAFHSVLSRHGIAVDPQFVLEGDALFETGVTLGKELLSRKDRPTAILAGSDEQAFGVYSAAHSLGLRVPQDISVIGFDNVDVGVWAQPPLTTVHQPLDLIAKESVRLLIGAGSLSDSSQPRIELPSQLILRSSTAAPPS
ncbi:MAG: LacI family DNA-binding transcriptional regulator, partial [Actinomycetaceae bacterium]|nr:LacI family DNA-binding transcriptional regulator [Actinomycetaceae bacterium]